MDEGGDMKTRESEFQHDQNPSALRLHYDIKVDTIKRKEENNSCKLDKTLLFFCSRANPGAPDATRAWAAGTNGLAMGFQGTIPSTHSSDIVNPPCVNVMPRSRMGKMKVCSIFLLTSIWRAPAPEKSNTNHTMNAVARDFN